MPRSRYFKGGQLITFQIAHFSGGSGYYWMHARKGHTCAIIAAQFGHPGAAQHLADLNNVGVYYRFKESRRIKVPNSFRGGEVMNVLADDMLPPTITDGYAILQVVARPGMVGVAQAQGYNPMAMDVPIRFESENKPDSQANENRIALLEKMAGRGTSKGRGAPPVLRLSTTDNHGKVVPLIPLNYQWHTNRSQAPLWRIAAISWDTGAWRNFHGKRIRQKAVVTVWEYTPISLQSSLTERAQDKKKKAA